MEQIILNNYQLYTLNKLIKHDNCFLFWPRQTGKTTLMSFYIGNYVKNNYGQNIIFIVNDKKRIRDSNYKIVRDLYDSKVITKNYNNSLFFINDNILKFIKIDNIINNPTGLFNNSLIIYDEFYYHEKLINLVHHLKYVEKYKSIFTSTDMNIDIIKKIDFKNNYYININTKYQKFPEFDYKENQLMDFNDLSYQRKSKIKLLNKISIENF